MPHIHELIDFTSSIYIVHEGKVLLHLHAKTGKWLAPGGHIEPNEDQEQCARREAKEETGFEVELIGGTKHPDLADDASDLLPPRFMNRHVVKGTHEHVDHTYFARVTGGSLQPEGDAEMRWFSREELERNDVGMSRAVRAYALTALDEVR